MECQTIDYYDEDGNKVYKPKKPYNTLDEAIAEAKIVNSQKSIVSKVVAYKCSICHKFHVGRNGKPLTEKQREKAYLHRKLHI